MKNRISVVLAVGIMILAAVGILGMLFSDPSGFIQRIAVIILIGAAIYFIARRFSGTNPEKKEQRAFLKAAKQSKKRLNQKSGDSTTQRSALASLTSLKKNNKTKKKSPAHLTVIEGKKSKKKNRVSF